MSSTLINFRNVSLDFPIEYTKNNFSIKQLNSDIGGIIKREKNNNFVNAIKNANFTIKKGDSVGILGHNGSGKSTLLRLMAEILFPTKGVIKVNGQVSTLFNLGMGLNENLSGYENIYSVSILNGISRSDVKKNIDDIINFAGLGDFINLPVRIYSPGMKARLLFGISTARKPNILLVDEVFGVGDKQFSSQAEDRMQRMLENTSILCFASHSEEKVRKVCNRIFKINHGLITEE